MKNGPTTSISTSNFYTITIRPNHEVIREKLDQYNKILDHISEINNKLVEIDHNDDGYKSINNSHRMIYDQTYIIECLIYAEMKTLEAQLKEEKSNEIEKAVQDYF